MARVDVDIAAVREFAAKLKTFVEGATQLRRNLTHAHKQVGEKWDDPVYQRVSKEVEESMRGLDAFLKIINPEIPRLHKAVERLEEYLRGR